MKVSNWLVINKNGVKTVRKSKPSLDWDEIAVKINLEIPNELFQRPTIEANVKVTDVPNTVYEPELIIASVKDIEQQLGAKINLTVSHVAEEGEQKDVNN